MIIQIFGLQGSGTNFLEWTIMNNFEGLIYEPGKKEVRNVKGDVWFGKRQNLKHCYPILDNIDLALIIKRPFDEWINSDKIKNSLYNREIYDYYYDTPFRENWSDDKFIILDHHWCVRNYYSMLELISNKSGASIRKDWNQPEFRFNTGRKMLNTKYKY